MATSAATDTLFSGADEIGRTDALVVAQDGELVFERYRDGVAETDTLRSWSMAKSMLHAAVGMLVTDGQLDLDAPAPVPHWQTAGDPRGAITLHDLMTMRAGLSWTEEPVDGAIPDVATMLYGNEGGPQPDTALWAADRPLAHAPGRVTQYSSGVTNIVSAIVRDAVGGPVHYEPWLRSRLFDPLGMTSPSLRFDRSGTWLASSYCFCTARDFVRFGQLYLDAGMVGSERLLPADWVATAHTETGRDRLGRIHTMHWWMLGDNPWGAYFASGYLGQYVLVVPPLRLVIARLGETPTEQRHHVSAALTQLIADYKG
ncbi:MAG: CubicO group peptidase (beta-lactamase class C family) [Candidatus Aldehydirespiratoraceae bacterium]|jgi:CubicO group peptidase (beta-lactamase class C family)